jgi:hypothetical protein
METNISLRIGTASGTVLSIVKTIILAVVGAHSQFYGFASFKVDDKI